ncbi:YdiK family protein [Fervidibacillus halotolerans]|uniref:YdiK family protein n=1 Tax=Fervidibacillus halotolerans TaxID=2980027 RepID=A0A9E8LZT1_9BACI|nr:YdiK family protein [Fervidibacillus halotolerans]WAA12576.1 YdiK family protein [Fervidibacillus halotolerans]
MKSPISVGIIYILLGIIFTFFAIQQVLIYDWGFFAYLLIIFAGIDIGTGIKIFYMDFLQKKKKEM